MQRAPRAFLNEDRALALAAQNAGEGRDTLEAVATLKRLTDADMAEVNAEILRRMSSPVEMIPTLAGHLINSGGKRLRPMLTLAAARLCGYEGQEHVKLAAAVEFIHTATLLHDDVVDESALRRGDKTANTIWGNQASVLVGDFLFSRAFELMVAAGDLKILGILSAASSVIAEGEVLQLTTQNNLSSTREDYLAVIEAKTAALFAAAAEVGAVVAARPETVQEALKNYGRNLGIAYQLVDDALDYSGREAALGKTVGDDFREGKMTLPVLTAYARATSEEKTFWERTLGQGVQHEGDFDRACKIIDREGLIAETFETARRYAANAKRDLETAPSNPWREALSALPDFAVSRTY
ncbi:MAG: polyprenyl synthetase family protein [Pseudomonadota bacterium]